MKSFLFTFCLFYNSPSFAQKKTAIGVAFYDLQSAQPFSKITGAFSGALHPGIELSKRKIFKERKKYAWLLEAKASLFYHRFVQWGIPVSLNVGYQRKISSSFTADITLGGGYLHSIPAAQKFKLNGDGYYDNNKGIGRAQATANLGIAFNYSPSALASHRLEIFAGYHQLLQFPYIKSYVPFLPYNQLQLGIRKGCSPKKVK